MQHKTIDDIRKIDPLEWNRHHDGSFFFTHQFLTLLNESRVEDAEYKYILFSDSDKPVGMAILSSFQLKLDLISGEPMIVRFIKHLKPDFFKVPVIFAGTPGSFGQAPFYISKPKFLDDAINAIHQEMQNWAKEKKVRLGIWKELPENFSVAKLNKLNYLQFPSLPDMQLKIKWTTAEEYLSEMRSNYRRKVKRSFSLWKQKQGFELSTFGRSQVKDFVKGYQAVMDRTPTKLETYPEEFFYRLTESGLEVEILTVSEEGNKLSALLLEEDQVMSFILVAKPEARYQKDLYNRLLHATVFTAIERGKSMLRLGQTSMYSKSALGAKSTALDISLKHDNEFIHFLLKHFAHLLFPDPKFTDLNVFKKKTTAQEEELLKIPA